MTAIPKEESLTVEFKSDAKRLSDHDLVAAVVCLTNTDGGDIYLGVEKDGRVTGLHSEHRNVTGMTALIANRTSPSVSVRVEIVDVEGMQVAKVSVPKSRRPVATTEGLLQRRRLKADGTPECTPFFPHEFISHQANLGALDYSALPIDGASPSDLDPLERERLRQLIERYGGDRTLLQLADEELDGALGLITRVNSRRVPTVTGMLLIGKELSIRQHLPTHEVAMQVLEGTEVKVNEFLRTSLLRAFERVWDQFTLRVVEEEVQVGLFRVPVPNYDRRAFREAFVNALIHRDYAQLGAIHVRWEQDDIVISNPGGFTEGVTLQNILVVEPRPRNPNLADAIKRIGLAERTGRGVDLIYQGMLRYGRSAPDYSRSDRNNVAVRLIGGRADLGLLRVIIEEEKRTGAPMLVSGLIALTLLREERRLDIVALADAIQGDEAAARRVIERLVESGLAEGHGVKKGRTYTLSARLYKELGGASEYVRQAGFDPIQQEQMILTYVNKHGKITRRQVADLCRIGSQQAARVLRKMAANKKLRPEGKGRSTFYVQEPNN